MFIVIGVFALVMLLGTVTYAFFNYTRTGAINSIKTGNIYFNSEQGLGLNLTNVFPMTSSEAENAQLDVLTIEIEGNTTYSDGEEFEVSIVDVTNTLNGKKIPINYIATYEPATVKTIGSSNNDYFNARNSKNGNIYALNTTGDIKEGKQVLTGNIDNEGNGIEGTLTIKAYIDADRIAISDTYYENAPSPSPSASPITCPTDEYGTTNEWVNGRVVFTTDEWNSLSSNGMSFKIKVESNEGILWIMGW